MRASVLRFPPILADADVDGERRIQRIRAGHLVAHELLHRPELRVRHLEQQLVVHLQDELRTASFLAQAAMDADHRHLDDVGVRSLHDEVDGQPFAERAGLAVRSTDLRHRTTTPEQ